ncbi:MAG: hypothetical protein M3Q33_02580, partial [Acidobacteriota bacterium]|nr:hypothetical protein [Acidobacteriota bacterium]
MLNSRLAFTAYHLTLNIVSVKFYLQVFIQIYFRSFYTKMSLIEEVWAREILDSRGNPTVEAEVI